VIETGSAVDAIIITAATADDLAPAITRCPAETTDIHLLVDS